jgi:hypothetical protein
MRKQRRAKCGIDWRDDENIKIESLLNQKLREEGRIHAILTMG